MMSNKITIADDTARASQEGFRALAEETIGKAEDIGREFATRCGAKGLQLPDRALAADFLAALAELILTLPAPFQRMLATPMEERAKAALAKSLVDENFRGQLHTTIARVRDPGGAS